MPTASWLTVVSGKYMNFLKFPLTDKNGYVTMFSFDFFLFLQICYNLFFKNEKFLTKTGERIFKRKRIINLMKMVRITKLIKKLKICDD